MQFRVRPRRGLTFDGLLPDVKALPWGQANSVRADRHRFVRIPCPIDMRSDRFAEQHHVIARAFRNRNDQHARAGFGVFIRVFVNALHLVCVENAGFDRAVQVARDARQLFVAGGGACGIDGFVFNQDQTIVVNGSFDVFVDRPQRLGQWLARCHLGHQQVLHAARFGFDRFARRVFVGADFIGKQMREQFNCRAAFVIDVTRAVVVAGKQPP